MAKLKPEDLDRIAEKTRRVMLLREGTGRARVVVHMGTCGIAAGARPVVRAFLEEVAANNADDVIVTTSSCAGLCSREPMATVEIEGQPPVKYVDLTPDKAKAIFAKHVVGGEIAAKYALGAGSERML